MSAEQAAEVHVHVHEQPRGMNHVPHLILTFFTAGFWIPFWILAAILHSNDNRRTLTAGLTGTPAPPRARKDEYGIVIPVDERFPAVLLFLGGALLAVLLFVGGFLACLGNGAVGGAVVMLVLTVALGGAVMWRGATRYRDADSVMTNYWLAHKRTRESLELRKVMKYAEPASSTDTFGTCPSCGHIDTHMITGNSEAGTTRNCAVCLNDWTVKHAR